MCKIIRITNFKIAPSTKIGLLDMLSKALAYFFKQEANFSLQREQRNKKHRRGAAVTCTCLLYSLVFCSNQEAEKNWK